MAETIMAWIGTVAVALWGLAGLGCAWAKWREKGWAKGYDEGRAHVLNCIQGDAHWFSEDEPTYRLLQEIAGRENMATYTLRERWRQRRSGIALEARP
jgi:hypothetical protein